MCGLTGYYLTRNTPEARQYAAAALARLLAFSSVRGIDATGLGSIESGKLKAIKTAKPSYTAINTPPFRRYLETTTAAAIIGHTRQMTKGEASNPDNNHPVKSGKLLVTHNGIVTNDDDLYERHALKRKAQVDSEIIPALIGHHLKKNLTNAIKKTYKEIRGSSTAAILYQDEPSRLYLAIRTSPLTLAYHEPTGIIFYASTERILSQAFTETQTLFGLFIRKHPNPDIVYYEADDDTLYILSPDKIISTKLPEPEASSYLLPSNYSPPSQPYPRRNYWETKISGHNPTLPIVKPSMYATTDLEERQEIIEMELESSNLTGHQRKILQTELTQIENTLAARYRQQSETLATLD